MNDETATRDVRCAGGELTLEDKVALVTGASSGLGVEFAHGLASRGANLVLAARRTDDLKQTAEDVRSQYGVEALPVTTDVTCESDVSEAVARAMSHFGRLDVLVNNAGSGVLKPLLEHSLDDWRHVVDANLTSTFLGCREAARAMKGRRGGSIINIASIFGLRATREFPQVGYYASKGGVIALTKALAAELGEDGIRVNAVAPGFFPTPMGTAVTQHLRETLLDPHTCLPSRPELHWIRGAVCFLASEEAAFITGQTIAVDGGWTAM